MITFNVNGVDKQLRNDLNELTIPEFEKICLSMTLDADDYFDRYINIFSVIGLTIEDIETIAPDEFISLIKKFDITKWDSTEFKKEIVIGDKTFEAYTGDKFVLSIRDLSKIEKYIKLDREKYLAEILAVIYKDKSVAKELWYNENHIAGKAQLFRDNVKADVVLPYVNLILNDVMVKLNSTLTNGNK